MDHLLLEIQRYLAFMDEAREEDHLWREYVAWKELTRKRLGERLQPYSMRS